VDKTLLKLAAIGFLATVRCAPAPPAPAQPALITQSPTPAPPPAPSRVLVQLLAINDLHGNLEPPSGHDGSVLARADDPKAELAIARGAGATVSIPAGGVAYLATHIRELRKNNPNTVVVSAGDLTGASPLVSNLFSDEPVILAMNLIGLDFEGVGNHDFDRGLVELLRLQSGGIAARVADSGAPEAAPFSGAKFKYLAANVLGKDGTTVFPPYAIKEFLGVKVAFIGMTLEGTPTITTPEATAGLAFKNEVKTANALVPELRARGVAASVLLVHQGGFQSEGGTYDSCEGFKGDLATLLPELDPTFRVIVSGHTHQSYNCTVDGRLVTSASSYGRLVTKIDLTLDPARNELVDAHAKNVIVTHDVAPDPEVAALVADYVKRAAPFAQRVVGYLRGSFTRDPKTAHSPSCETPLGDLIADAQLAATRGAGAVIAFMNPGGVRTDLVPDPGEGASPIRYGAVFEVQPFGNRLVTVSLTGAEIKELLDKQFTRDRPRVLSVSKGFSYRYVFDAASHTATIDPASIRLSGSPIAAGQRYRVTINSFLASGGDGFSVLARATDRSPGALDIDAMTAYIAKASAATSALGPATPTRIVGNACE
jgi:5'-nucleotidase